LTTPSSATQTTGGILVAPPEPGLNPLTDSVAPWRRRASAARRAVLSPRVLHLALDVAAVVFIVMAFATTALSAEFLFHCVFVTLVLHAFFFGLRGTLVRIGLASIPLLVYADAQAFGLIEPPLELTEWPLMFVIAVLVAWMADMRSSTSRRYASLFRIASERLLTIEEDERRRVAGELHDGVGQVLTALTLTLDAAAAPMTASEVRERVVAARSLADTALAQTRDLSHRMRPARLEERGLVTAVRDLAAQSGFDVTVEANAGAADPDLLGPTATVEVFRIIQEALANAARHSGAPGAHLTIARRDEQLLVEVADEGRGFDPAAVADSGIGLAGMVERARLIGADLAVATAPGAGTVLSLALPIGRAR
jgi:signal transduction histidine kinase